MPLRLKQAAGQGELHRSTGCRDIRLAKIVAAELVAHWHRSIEALQHMDINKLQAGSLKLLGDGYASLMEAAEECGTSPSDLATRLHARHFGLYVQAQKWTGWLTDDIHADFDHWHDSVTGEVEVVIDGSRLGGTAGLKEFSGMVSLRFPDEVSEVLTGAATSAQICQFLFWPSGSRAFVCDLPGRPIQLKDLLVRRVDVSAITRQLLESFSSSHNAAGRSSAPSSKKTAPLFSHLCTRYFDENSDLWVKNDHRRRKTDHTKMFIQIAGDRSIDAIDRQVMREFAAQVKDIPRERHKFAQSLGLSKASYKELITLKKAKAHPGLSEGEQRKILDTISQIFAWAIAEEEMVSNPAVRLGGEAIRKSKKRLTKAHEQRDPLAPEDLEKVFSAHWFKNGVGKLTAKGDYYHYRPHYYWLPILALYCGGRLNELCQLYLKDVIVNEGVHCLDFNLQGDDKLDIDEDDLQDAIDKSLKNISSARIIPLPQLVIDLGLIDYVQRLRDLGHTRLFPELLFDTEKGYGKYAGKWFNDSFMGKQLEIPRNRKKTFHSMRHNFATALGRVQAEPNLKADLMGHKRRGSTTEVRYDKGFFEDRKLLIDSISHPHPPLHPFDVKEGIKALNDALSLKVSRVGTKEMGGFSS